jgi:hypothetical protein
MSFRSEVLCCTSRVHTACGHWLITGYTVLERSNETNSNFIFTLITVTEVYVITRLISMYIRSLRRLEFVGTSLDLVDGNYRVETYIHLLIRPIES